MSDEQPQPRPVVYLICFAQTPYKHAKHYIGMTSLPIADRLARHRDGKRGARLLRAVLESGGDFTLADTWECDTVEEARAFERRLKSQNSGPDICSICNPGNGRGGGRGRNRHGCARAKADGNGQI